MLVWDVDWATVSWRAIDRHLARRVLAAWDKHLTHPSLPQTFAAQLRNAGFEDVRMDAHAFATTEFIHDAYGGSLVPLLEQYVAEQGGVSQEEAKAWADEQRELGDRGEFFFTVTQFCFTATRRS
jgi:arsenite methyltransferase